MAEAAEVRAQIAAQRALVASDLAKLDAGVEGEPLDRAARTQVAQVRGWLISRDKAWAQVAREVDRREAGKGSARQVRKALRAAEAIGRRGAALHRDVEERRGG